MVKLSSGWPSWWVFGGAFSFMVAGSGKSWTEGRRRKRKRKRMEGAKCLRGMISCYSVDNTWLTCSVAREYTATGISNPSSWWSNTNSRHNMSCVSIQLKLNDDSYFVTKLQEWSSSFALSWVNGSKVSFLVLSFFLLIFFIRKN